jgi:hypothetical protein
VDKSANPNNKINIGMILNIADSPFNEIVVEMEE